jgi:bifunctional DNase/RNase
MDDAPRYVEMELRELQVKLDSLSGSQVVVLTERDGTREFPIFIGFTEAIALDAALHRQVHQRPMTHDLVGNVFEGMDCRLTRVLVDDLREDVFFGKLVLQKEDGQEVLIDARPSDAIVLATKHGASIHVAEHVLEKAARPFD